MNGFISYSHHDERYVERLHVHLANLKREGLIDTWFDRDITVGASIDQSISEAFDDAELFLAIVSPDFIASDYCYEKEMQRALERHHEGTMTIVPIIVEPCDWKTTPLSSLKAVPKDGKPVSDWANQNTAFLDIINEIRRVVSADSAAIAAKGKKANETVPSLTELAESGSSRYRPKRDFDAIDKAKFRDAAFAEIVAMFTKNVEELNQVDGLRGHLSVGADSFEVSAINKNVRDSEAYLQVRRGGGGRSYFGEISFVTTPGAGQNTSNGGFSIDSDDFDLFLNPQIIMGLQRQPDRMSPEEAAEYLWRDLMERAGISYA